MEKVQVAVLVDKDAAVKAGRYNFGKTILELEEENRRKPLSPEMTARLVELNYTINQNDVGRPIDGTESLADLLQEALKVRAAKRQKEEEEDGKAFIVSLGNILKAPLHTPYAVSTDGLVTLSTPAAAPLIRITGASQVVERNWTSAHSTLWDSEARSHTPRALRIREAVLGTKEVQDRIQGAEAAFEIIQRELKQAEAVRKRCALEAAQAAERQQKERAEAERRALEEYAKTHLTPSDYRRFQAGFMPEQDVLREMVEVEFLDYLPFKPFFQPTAEQLAALFMERGLLDEIPYPVGDLETAVFPASSLTSVQFGQLEKIQSIGPAAVEVEVHTMWLEGLSKCEDPELSQTVAKVTLDRPPFKLVKRFVLDPNE